MLALLPQIALVLCVLIFIGVVYWALFVCRKDDAKRYASLPLERDGD